MMSLDEKRKHIIKPIVKNDLTELFFLWKRLVISTGKPCLSSIDTFTSNICNMIDYNVYYGYVLMDNAFMLKGFIDCQIYNDESTAEKVAHIMHYYLIPEYRGSSLSSSLYRLMLKAIKMLKISKITATTRNPSIYKKYKIDGFLISIRRD